MKAVRKVATPEGAKFYGMPIGSPILPAVEHAKNLAAGLAGLLPPKGGLDAIRTSTGMKIHETSLTGKSTFSIPGTDGLVTYAVPTGSTVIRSKDSPEMVYVRVPGGEIHVFNTEGEIDLGSGLTKVLTAKFGPDFSPTNQYTIEHLTATVPEPVAAVAVDLTSAATGAKAVDAKGHTIFVKNADGSWKHDSFGVDVSATDLQHALDSGELTIQAPEPAKIPETKVPEPVKTPEPVTAPDLSKIPLTLATQMHDMSPMAQQKIAADQDPQNVLTDYLVAGDDVWRADVFGNIDSLDPDGVPTGFMGNRASLKETHSGLVEIKHHFNAGKNRPYGFPQKIEWVHGETVASFGYQHSLTFYKQNRKTGQWHNITGGGVNEFQGWTSQHGLTLSELQAQAKTKKSTPTFWLPETGEKKNWTQYNAELIPESANAPAMQAPAVPTPAVPAPAVPAPEPKKIPETKSPATDVSTYGKGDTIAKYGHLREMGTGTTLSTSYGTLTKNASGGWARDSGNLVSPGILADHVISGDLKFESHPKGSPDEMVDLLNVPGLPGTKKSDVTAAIAALEAHSGFQISYGFKSIPDNPLADKVTQDAVKVAAMQAFPGLKPKPAFVAYLKSKNGIEAPVVSAPVSAADTIHFGALVPEAKSIQGMNGGDFTVSDVTEAISILEAFNGKAFKAELNKKGNALGILNPNDLVGFDKDKTVVKEKFLLLLQQKLLAGSDAPTLNMPVNPLEGLKVSEMGVGDTMISTTGSVWSKNADGSWSPDYNANVHTSAVDIQKSLDHHFFTEHVKAPDVPAVWDGTTATTAPEGTMLFKAGSGDVYTKTSNTLWAHVHNGNAYGMSSSSSLQQGLTDGSLTVDAAPAATPDPDAKTAAHLDAAELGSTITSTDGVTFTKDTPTMWSHPNSGGAADWTSAEVLVTYGPFSHIQPPEPESPNPLEGMKISDMSVGDILTGHAGTVWTKQPGGEGWSDGKGIFNSNEFMQQSLDLSVFAEYAKAPVSVNNVEAMPQFVVGQEFHNTSDLAGLPTGTVLIYPYSTSGTAGTYTKTAEGKYH